MQEAPSFEQKVAKTALVTTLGSNYWYSKRDISTTFVPNCMPNPSFDASRRARCNNVINSCKKHPRSNRKLQKLHWSRLLGRIIATPSEISQRHLCQDRKSVEY